MRKRTYWLVLALLLLCVGGLLSAALPRPVAQAQDKAKGQSTEKAGQQRRSAQPIVVQATRFGVTARVRDLPETRGKLTPNDLKTGRAEARQIKQIKNPPLPKSNNDGLGSVDGALITPKDSNRGTGANAPAPAGVNFEGLSNNDNAAAGAPRVLPPDTIGDVGPNHYVQAVNLVFRVFNKSGAPLTPPRRLSSLFATLQGSTCAANDDGDPTVNYDPLADRWVITQFAVPGPFFQCVAVSQTPDPTGAYYAYEFPATPGSNNVFNDYPKFGVWPDAYYQTTNQFNAAGTAFLDAGVYAYDRRKMLAGDPTATYIYFDTASLFPGQGLGGLLPSTLDNSTAPPPPGRPNTFAYFTADEFGDPQGDALRLFDFRANFDNPPASSFRERAESPVRVAAFNPLTPTGRNDVEQPVVPTNAFLDTIGDRIVHRLQYRNFGTATAPVESLVVNHTVNVGTGNTQPTHQAAPRYYQLEATPGASGQFSVRNQGTFVPDGIEPAAQTVPNRWMGSTALDNDGNLALGYSVSNRTNIFPGIRVTGRLANAPSGELEPEVSMIEGSGSQTSTSGRWGDYSSMNVDPVDDCTFWYTNEYYQTTSSAGWQTRVGNFRYPSCTAPAQGTLRVNVTNCETGAVIQGAAVRIENVLYGTTIANGGFQTQLAPGTYSVTITLPNFTTVTRTVTITNGGTTVIDGCLQGTPVISADGATITAENCTPPNNAIDPGETVTVNLRLRNTGGASTSNLVATIVPNSGVTNPTPTSQSFGALAPGQSAGRDFTFTAQGACGSTITVTLQLSDNGVNLGTVNYTFTLGTQTVSFTENFDGVTPPALPAGWTSTASGGATPWVTTSTVSDTPPNSAFAGNPTTASDNILESPSIAISTASAQLTFRNRYNLEATFDGGVLEISVGGGAFQDILAAGGTFVSGGYNGTARGTGNPLANRAAWTGNSNNFITTTVNLPASAAGQSIRLRWRVGTDSSVAATGAFVGQAIDTIRITDGFTCSTSCGGGGGGTPRIDTLNEVLTRNANGTVTVTMTVANKGTATATNVTITTAELNAVAGQPVPQNIGTLAPNETRTVTFTFPNPGATGAEVVLTVRGTYSGGGSGVFFSDRKVRLP